VWIDIATGIFPDSSNPCAPQSAPRVPNGRGRTGLDQPVQSKVESAPMVENGLTRQS